MDYDIRKEFPRRTGVRWQQLKKTPEAEFSITRHAAALEIHAAMWRQCGALSKLVLADGTANIGSDVIRFGLVCKRVFGVEIDKATFDALSANVAAYKLLHK